MEGKRKEGSRNIPYHQFLAAYAPGEELALWTTVGDCQLAIGCSAHVWLQRKFKVESEVENWIQKFDADMGERQVRNSTKCVILYFAVSHELSLTGVTALILCMHATSAENGSHLRLRNAVCI